MSRSCPICDTHNESGWTMAFLRPDGWTLPEENTICECSRCGMIYYNNYNDQGDYDAFYRDHGARDSSSPFSQNTGRLDELADIIKQHIKPSQSVVDFGGGVGYLERKLKADGYQNIFTVDVGEEMPYQPDLLVASNVIEHLYDVKGVLKNILRGTDKVLVEVPDARMMLKVGTPILDYNQKHINHFTPTTIDKVFTDMGYSVTPYMTPKMYNGYALYRAIYWRAPNTFNESMRYVERNTFERLQKLRAIKTPVIVWGVGDLALHLLVKANIDIRYFVDIDPVYRGESINGLPIKEKVTSKEPILILAHNQASSIRQTIMDLRLTNEVITV